MILAAATATAAIGITLWEAIVLILGILGISIATYNISTNNSYDQFISSIKTQIKNKIDDSELIDSFYKFYVANLAVITLGKDEFIENIDKYLNELFEKLTNGLNTGVSSGKIGNKIKAALTFPAFVIRFLYLIASNFRNGKFSWSIESGEPHLVSATYNEMFETGSETVDSVSLQLAKESLKDSSYSFDLTGNLHRSINTESLPISGYPYIQCVIIMRKRTDGSMWYTPVYIATSEKINSYNFTKSIDGWYLKSIFEFFNDSGNLIDNAIYPMFLDTISDSFPASGSNISVSKLNVTKNDNFVKYPDPSNTIESYDSFLYIKNMTYENSKFVFDSTMQYEVPTICSNKELDALDLSRVNSKLVDANADTSTMDLTIVTPADISKLLEDVRSAIKSNNEELISEIISKVGVLSVEKDTYVPLNPAIPFDYAEMSNAVEDYVDNTGVVIKTPDAPIISSNASGWVTIYRMSDDQLKALGGYLWSNNFYNNIIKLFSNPLDAIINSYSIPYNFGGTYGVVKIGNVVMDNTSGFGTDVTGYVIDSNIKDIDMGSISIPRKYDNFLDYEPFTKIYLMLPFIGIVQLSTNDVMGGTIEIKYRVDLYTGSVLAMITVKNKTISAVMYQFSGNMSMSIPLSSSNYSRSFGSLIGAAGSIAAGVATGGAYGIASAAIGATGSALSAGIDIQRSGGMNSNTGALGTMKPYIIVELPVSSIPKNYYQLNGNVSNLYTTIGTLNGFSVLESFNLNTITRATNSEKSEIETILRTGFYV